MRRATCLPSADRTRQTPWSGRSGCAFLCQTPSGPFPRRGLTGVGIHPHPAEVCRRVGVERRPDPWPPGTRRAAGGGCAFRVGPHFSRPSARRELLRHRAGCAQRSLPVPCMLQRCPILGEGARPAGRLPAAMLRPYPRSNGSEGNGIGNARGIPPRGVGRRHLFGCQGVRTSSRGRTSRGSVTSAPHPWRASSAGVSILDIVPAGSAPCPIGLYRIGLLGEG